MEWKVLNSQNDIEKLFKEFYYFHDSCITEFSCKTGMKVDEKKEMRQNDVSSIKIIFKSQLCNTIEIHFEDIKKLNIHIYDKDKYFNNIDEAKMYISNNYIYWADNLEWDEDNLDNEITYIVCEKAQYIRY